MAVPGTTEVEKENGRTTLYERYTALTDESMRSLAERYRHLAMGYAQGWQDALRSTGVERDTDAATSFGYAYGIHAAEYMLERRGHRLNVEDAYVKWQNGETEW